MLLTVAALLIQTSASCPSLTSGSDSLPSALWDILTNLDRESRLDIEQREALLRLMAREEIAADLFANRITLIEAAERFAELNQQMPNSGRNILQWIPGNSDGERLCRQVILWMECEQKRRRDPEASATLCSLESQLEELLKRDGVIRLPGMKNKSQ
jgi:hypothetical protein